MNIDHPAVFYISNDVLTLDHILSGGGGGREHQAVMASQAGKDLSPPIGKDAPWVPIGSMRNTETRPRSGLILPNRSETPKREAVTSLAMC
jgi:hypothetical protein